MVEGGTMKTEDLWTPYKELEDIVIKHLTEENSKNLVNSELENALRKHKQNFIALLQNPPKNPKSREEIKKGMTEGITVREIGHQILSKELYEETIILSDMFEINEYVALDLLCTAQLQMSFHPNLPRGLVAVLLYYDGRRALLTALKWLVQARSGVQWALNVPEDVTRFITMYTDELMENGLFNRIFELLRTLDMTKEFEKLHQNVALGGPKHRKQVKNLFQGIRTLLAETVFLWATQSGLKESPTLSLIKHLRDVKVDEEATGTLDIVNLTLQMALLAALDLSILHTREDGEEMVKCLPILSQKTYLSDLMKEFGPSKPKWKCEGLQAISTLGLSVSIASLRLVRSSDFQELIGKEDAYIDQAIEANVFDFMHNVFLETKQLYEEEFMYRRMHYLLTDFIIYQYPKVKELRLRADETARTIQVYLREGLEAPVTLPRHFEDLLFSLAKLYNGNKLKKPYTLDFWSPVEINPNQLYSYQAPPRAVSLFKFVRSAGDMLPATLFVPYVTFLSSISTCQQSARNCFNMLKQVGLLTSSTLSWDHFFMSFAQYYSNLREEQPLKSDTVYGHRIPYHKVVSPLEIKGLESVLLLVRTVADNDEFSRMALCEHPGWAPLTVLLGLVGCSVPTTLKAELLLTLAALSKSAENATQMWENLEASQVLVTIPSTSSFQPRGIQTELEEVESREEEYPLTRAFLTLLDTLTDLGIPRMLGAGPRKPGFDPYLSFIINSVFLKYSSRSYKDPAEKWMVANLCLKLLEKFLRQYEPQPSDISSKESIVPPGFHLMIQLNNKTEILNSVMDVIHEGCVSLDTFAPFTGEETLKECVLHSLNILHRVLLLQGTFSTMMAASPEPIILMGIMKLLLTTNRRSGKPDHCINIAKYINCQYRLPEHAYSAIRVLTSVLNSPVTHNHFVKFLFAIEDVAKSVRFGFVECLDAVIDDLAEEQQKLCLDIKLEIFKLLKQCIVFNVPNFSHYLLGFDIKQDISKTVIHLPGVNNYPRTCFHSIFAMLDMALKGTIPSKMLEAIYNMLYILCSNEKTSGPVLRFVKSSDNFFINHLKYVHKHLTSNTSLLKQAAWLIKTVAIELKVCSKNKQIKYLKQLTNFLTGYPTVGLNDAYSLLPKTNFGESDVSFQPIAWNDPEFYMSNLIKHFRAKAKSVDIPVWDLFNASVLEDLIKKCESEGEPKLINIKKLHQILNEELKNIQTSMLGQIQAIGQEIQRILKYVLELNSCRESNYSAVQFVESWCHVINVIVLYVPQEVISPIEKQYLYLQLLPNVLKTTTANDIMPEINLLLSGTVLLALDDLKKCHVHEWKTRKCVEESKRKVSVVQTNIDALKEILSLIVQWIFISDLNDKLRINIYACLNIFLQLTHADQSNEDLSVANTSFISRLDGTKTDVKQLEGRAISIPADVISDWGERLLDVLCHDCISAHDMCKMLAMSSVGELISLTGSINWITFMSARGYLKYIIQSVLDSDRDLKNALEPSSKGFKVLYVYSAKLTFLIKLASNRMGAELLLEHKLLSCLSNMDVFSYHPEISKWDCRQDLGSFLPTIEQQYMQIWLPTFDLCNALLTTLGTDNKSALVQIIHYVLSHKDVIELVLRSGTTELSRNSLKELGTITLVLARTASNDLIDVLENTDIVQNKRAQMYRLQKLMFALLPKFLLTDSAVRNLLQKSPDQLNSYQTSDRLIYAFEIICNLLAYARNLVANHGIDHGGVGVIFEPNLKPSSKPNQSAYEQYPTLGVLVEHLITAVNYHQQEKVTLDRLQRKVKDIPDMSSVELKEFVDDSLKLNDLTTIREYIQEFTTEKLTKKQKEIKCCVFIIEQALYLIWSHLDFYMLKAIPRARTFGPNPTQFSLNLDGTLASAAETTWKITGDDISVLKQGLVPIFNDSFTKQLVETLQDLSESDKGLAEALLRKIKRLIQFVPVK